MVSKFGEGIVSLCAVISVVSVINMVEWIGK